MHVRIAWEILHHQKKENPEKTSTTPNLTKAVSNAQTDMHRPPSHIFSSSSVLPRPPELSTTFPPGLQGRPYDAASIPSGFLGGPTSHLGESLPSNCNFHSQRNHQLTTTDLLLILTGSAVSPFGRYASPFNNFPNLTFGRDMPIGAPPALHDPWRK